MESKNNEKGYHSDTSVALRRSHGTEAEAEAPIPLATDGKNWLIGKGPDAEKD